MQGIAAKALLNLSIVLGVLSTAAFLLLWNEAWAAAINLFSGFASVIAFIATLSLAADYCPPRSEGFAFAALFDRHLDPLVVVSTAFTAVAFAFVPFLRLGDKRPGVPARAVGAAEN